MNHRARSFLAANAHSPVVYGSVTGPEGAPTGCFYRLADGKTFDLTSAELRSIPAPRWVFEEIAA